LGVRAEIGERARRGALARTKKKTSLNRPALSGRARKGELRLEKKTEVCAGRGGAAEKRAFLPKRVTTGKGVKHGKTRERKAECLWGAKKELSQKARNPWEEMLRTSFNGSPDGKRWERF